MIISVSRRTDIPAFYGEWFRNRLAAGSCLVPNPFNPRQVSEVSLKPGDVDAFVFWTRNPGPFLPVLDEVDARGIPYVFLWTFTGYGPPLEPCAPSEGQALSAFEALADRIGPERLVWRYDPIVLGPGLGPEEHVRRFGGLARRFRGRVQEVKVSLVDLYRKTERRLRKLENGEAFAVDPAGDPGLPAMLSGLVRAAQEAGMDLRTCAESEDGTSLGARPGRCVDPGRLGRIAPGPFPQTKDPGQRVACRCAPSRDIGMTDTCLHGCVYCYATRSFETAQANHARHDPAAPSLQPLGR
jgi:hypothetical protein